MKFENGQFVVVGPVERVMAVWVEEGSGFWEFVVEVEGGIAEVSDRQFGSESAALAAGLAYWHGWEISYGN